MNFFNSNIAIIFIFFVFKIIISPIICRFGFTIHVCQLGKHFSTKQYFSYLQYSMKAFSFYKHYLSYKKQVKWRSSLLVSKRSCQPNTAAWYFYLFFKVYQAAILPPASPEPCRRGFFKKPVMPFAVPSSVVTAAFSVL
jgi:hypothetical protein